MALSSPQSDSLLQTESKHNPRRWICNKYAM